MTVTAKCLVESKTAETAQSTQYTTPVATRTIIDKFTATNTSSATATLSVNLVEASATAGAGNLIVKTVAIEAGKTYTLPEVVGQVLNAGGLISTLASGSGIVIRISGREVTN